MYSHLTPLLVSSLFTRCFRWFSGRLAAPVALAFPAVVLPAQETAADWLRQSPTLARRESNTGLSEIIPVYFPPTPPPLGAAVDRLAQLLNLKWVAPASLGSFVNEPFYPRLATHLIAGSLPMNVRPRYDAYVSARARLRMELAEKIAATRTMAPETRLAELQEFARIQTPQLAELEWTAERLRRDLGTAHVQWTEDHRRSQRGKVRPPDEKGRRWEYEIVISAAFFVEGLSPGQRRLLREAAIELEGDPAASASGTGAGDPVFFSPDLSRVRFPAGLAPEVASKIAEYTREKDALKRELRDEVYELDSIRSDDAITDRLRALAKEHEPRLLALDARAEEIRRSAALLVHPAEPGISPAMASRWAALQAAREQLDASIVARVEPVRAELLTFRGPFDVKRLPDGRLVSSIDVRDVPDRREFLALTGHSPTPWYKAVFQVIRTELAAAEAAVADRAEELRAQEAGLVRELATAAGITPEQAAAAWERHDRLRRANGPQVEYALAVFEPGLSPEQRRLLFDLSLERLALPLPGGSLAPYPVVR